MSRGHPNFKRFTANERENGMALCNICPRGCAIDREKGERGYCRAGSDAVISHVCKHFYEEPPISGRNGSGAVFFGGCNLACVFCQNKSISRRAVGKSFDKKSLSELLLKVQDSGVHNINLVTPTPHARVIADALTAVKHKLFVPIVYNTSAYEAVDTIKMMNGLVDIYLPDMKYASEETALKYSGIKNYPDTAFRALEEMLSQQEECVIENDLMKRGVIVRHLCLPSCSKDSLALIERLSEYLPTYDFRLSLMSQYTPEFLGELSSSYREINRRITGLEYNRVANRAIELGFDGFFQQRASASSRFTPDFDAAAFGKSERIDIDEF